MLTLAILEQTSELSPWILVICGTLITGLSLWLLQRLLMARLRSITSKTRYTIDTVLVKAVAIPLSLMAIMLTVATSYWLLTYAELLPSTPIRLPWMLVQILCVAAVLIFLDRIVHGIVSGYSERSQTIRTSRSIIQTITRGIIVILGTLILLSTIGVSVTPLIASLGIGSLAVALALQPTLENIFSGIQLVIDKPIRVGDFIELESGEQGFVDKIGWRSTWVRMLQNNIVILPNSEIARSKIINYYYPEKELSVPVDVGVHYSSDLEHVEQVTLEVAREILVSHEWGVDDYKTFVVYTSFADSSINFTVMLRVKEYFNRFWVKSAFIKALHKRYKEEGIVIPFPIRAINTEQESAQLPTPK
ncbi:MAG TPA: mechanosensitive ion channel protein MscS [Opitutae bacterium]|nr:mechanosensitive ion channel protein MscS [Opitutae bacterium]